MATFQSGRDRRRLQRYLTNYDDKSTKILSTTTTTTTKNNNADDVDDDNGRRKKSKKHRQQSSSSSLVMNKINHKDKEEKDKNDDHNKMSNDNNNNEFQLELRKDVECFLRKHRSTNEQINDEYSVSDNDDDFLESVNPIKKPKNKSNDDDDHRHMEQQLEQRSQNLAKRARQTLSASMFRYLNEFLYTHCSFEARKSFDSNQFQKYHQAYDLIMQQWPLKPIEYIIDRLQERILKPDHRTVIADIGCGNQARIAEAFPNCTVYSYDLYSIDNLKIISADMCRLPLDDNQCDYVIYSLSLMPKNLSDVFCECNRILKLNTGYVMIVEVASRFADYGKKLQINSTKAKQQSMDNQKFAADFENFTNDLRQNFGLRLIEYNLLPPNNYFVYFLLNKIKTINVTRSATMIQLKPCVYRHRIGQQQTESTNE